MSVGQGASRLDARQAALCPRGLGRPAHHLYAGSYSDDDLRWWATRIDEWQRAGRDILVFFNNDGNGKAVRNATTLAGLTANKTVH
jgi:uncharacterized protein YecE (DUF72 family)